MATDLRYDPFLLYRMKAGPTTNPRTAADYLAHLRSQVNTRAGHDDLRAYDEPVVWLQDDMVFAEFRITDRQAQRDELSGFSVNTPGLISQLLHLAMQPYGAYPPYLFEHERNIPFRSTDYYAMASHVDEAALIELRYEND